jgi:hypothetical protein
MWQQVIHGFKHKIDKSTYIEFDALVSYHKLHFISKTNYDRMKTRLERLIKENKELKKESNLLRYSQKILKRAFANKVKK